MNLPTSSSTAASHRSNGPAAAGGAGEQQQQQQHGAHRLTPQEAAQRGASLAFQKQQQGSNNSPAVVGRQATGNGGGRRISRQPSSSSIRSQRDYADEAAERERERERKALFLTPVQGGKNSSQQHLLLPPRPGAAPTMTEGKSASFIAATLAASRSASPGTAVGLENYGVRQSPLPVVNLRRRSAASLVGAADERTDTTSLAPAASLISLFEKEREVDGEGGSLKGSPNRLVKRRPKSRSPHKSKTSTGREVGGLERESVVSASKPVPSPKPKVDLGHSKSDESLIRNPKPRSSQPQLQYERVDEESSPRNNESRSRVTPSPKPKPKAVTRAETPPPPVMRRADTVIVSPKPRRPETKPRLEAPASPNDANENSTISIDNKTDAKPKPPKPKTVNSSPKTNSQTIEDGKEVDQQRRPSIPAKSPVVSIKTRPPAPRKSSGLSQRLSPELKKRDTQRRSIVPNHDGQKESKLWTDQDATDARPTTSDSKSSNDSFVSASSVLTRDETDSLLTGEASSSRSITPKALTSRPTSTQPLPALAIRRSVTGPSLPLDSLSDAIMAGSLASARHTPISLNESRTPPALPPSRRKGGTTSSKTKSTSRRPSPHRMKHTLRQPKFHSDDEDARRPHHKKGLNHKKHAHHEGSRNRWREEITEREKKRYEAVWASNRGALLVATFSQQPAGSDPVYDPPGHQGPRKPLRDESYEELSEYVANVVVHDLWSRSRLPEPELAEVWDLVYGHHQGPGPGPGRMVHGALNKQEFVVGMWLIDQRLRGRKIPPRVSASVWNSAKGLRVLSPDNGHGHGHGHGHHKGKGKAR